MGNEQESQDEVAEADCHCLTLESVDSNPSFGVRQWKEVDGQIRGDLFSKLAQSVK